MYDITSAMFVLVDVGMCHMWRKVQWSFLYSSYQNNGLVGPEQLWQFCPANKA